MRVSDTGINPARSLWRFFSSIRLAISLILILIVISLIGTLVVQLPAQLARDSMEYLWWLDHVARPKYGVWVGPMEFLQLFDVFHSIWFVGTGLLLVLNITVCSINRWRSVWVMVHGTQVRPREEFYAGDSNVAGLDSSADPVTTLTGLTQKLKKRGYRTQTESGTDTFYLSATKNRFSPFGTYLGHLSLVMFVAGFLVTSYFGFRDPSFVVIEGAEQKVGHGTSLSLRLENFSDEYWPDGTPRDYRSEVVLYENGKEVKSDTIRVNQPLRYHGVRFYQSFFGPAATIRVQKEDGTVLYEDGVALSAVLQSNPFQRPTGSFLLSAQDLVVILVGPAVSFHDPSIAEDEIGLELYDQGTATPIAWSKLKKGMSVELENLQFTYVQSKMYSGFQVSRDPGGVLIWIASFLFIIGVGAVFYFARRQLWAMIKQVENGSQMFIRWAPVRGPGRNLEFQGLVEELQIDRLR